MTGPEAQKIIDIMRRETPIDAQKSLLTHALNRPVSRLDINARQIYATRLAELTEH